MTKAEKISVAFWFGIGPVVGIAIFIADCAGIIPAWVYSAFQRFMEAAATVVLTSLFVGLFVLGAISAIAFLFSLGSGR